MISKARQSQGHKIKLYVFPADVKEKTGAKVSFLEQS